MYNWLPIFWRTMDTKMCGHENKEVLSQETANLSIPQVPGIFAL